MAREPEYILNADPLIQAAERLEQRLRKVMPGFNARQDLNVLITVAVENFGQADPDLKIIRETMTRKAGEAARAKPKDSLPVYTIFDHPLDYPDHFVLRVSYALRTGQPIPGELIGIAKTLEGARKMLPPGLTCVGREAADEVQIVESWL
jgi:hypothetical protein